MAEEAAAETAAHARTRTEGGLSQYEVVIGTAAFVTSISQIELLGALPIRHVLLSQIGVTPEQMSFFLLISALAWYLKPIAGLISDSRLLFGTRRRHYMMLSAALAGFCWLLMALVPKAYFPIMAVAVILNGAMVVTSTTMGGLLVEEAQKFGATGRLSSLREAVNMLAAIIGLPIGGFLAEKAFGWTALLAAGLLFGLAVVVFFLLREEPVAQRNEDSWANAGAQLKTLYHSKTIWTAGILLFLLYMAPGLSTPLYFLQINTLAFSNSFIGSLGIIGGLTGVIGALLYARLCRELSLRKLLIIGIILSTLGTLLYVAYESRQAAMIIVGVNGFLGAFASIPLFDLAARATPAGCEGLGFALMMSLRNFAVYSADWVGSWLMHSHQWSFDGLVILNALTTFVVLFAIPFLPRKMIDKPDAAR